MLPDDYIPLNGCRSCGRDFTSTRYFDRHRVGVHDYLFSRDRPDGRRCMEEEEILDSGLRPLTPEEMLEGRYASRSGFHVPLYSDPLSAETIRQAHRATSEPVEALA